MNIEDITASATFSIDVDQLEVYVNGWYLGDIPLDSLSPEARYEAGVDANYDDRENKGGKDIRPDRENPDKKKHSFDYEKQVWIKEGKYIRCAHPESMNCKCYGKLHEGETAKITEHCH